MDNDTIYLRFSSMGKVLDPWAMSTSELRAELKARSAYETKMQPEQLVRACCVSLHSDAIHRSPSAPTARCFAFKSS